LPEHIHSIGIVGAGEITRKVHLPVLLNLASARVAWLFDRDEARAIRLARAYRVSSTGGTSAAGLPACDAVLLAIPVDTRGDYLSHFAATGAAVLCEKPFALTAAEHCLALEKFPAHRLGCGYMRRYFRSVVTLRTLVQTQIFGPLLSMRIHEGNRSKGSGVDSSFLDDATRGSVSGVLMDLGSHSLDMALHISGAQSFQVLSSDVVFDGLVDRRVQARIELRGEFAVPVQFDYAVSWLDRQSNRIELEFEQCTILSELGVKGEARMISKSRLQDLAAICGEAQGATTYNQAFYLQWRDFLEGADAGRACRTSAHSALLTTRLCEALLCAGRMNA
jgi:predicted dehydrogenase